MCYRKPENKKKALTKSFTPLYPAEGVWTSEGDPETDLRRTWTRVQKNVKMLSALKTIEEKPQLS